MDREQKIFESNQCDKKINDIITEIEQKTDKMFEESFSLTEHDEHIFPTLYSNILKED